MSTPQSLQSRIAELAMNGMYEPGSYARRGDLAVSELMPAPDGSVWFLVETVTPDTDRETVKVTIGPPGAR